MGKYSHTGLIGGAAPCALLLGALVFPATVLSEVDTNSDAKFAAPDQSQPNQYGTPAPGMIPGAAAPRGGFGHMPPGYYGPNPGMGAGYAPPQGTSPFDEADAPMQPPRGYAVGSSGGAPMPMQHFMPAPGYETTEAGKPRHMPRAGQGGMAGIGMSCPKGSPGCARGPFMRHGGGMGMGRRGMGARRGAGLLQLFQIPDLTDEQRGKIQDISDELRLGHWALMGEKMKYSTQLRRLYQAEPLDAKAIGDIYAKIFDAKRKGIEAEIEANQKAMDLLTEEQRKQLRAWKR